MMVTWMLSAVLSAALFAVAASCAAALQQHRARPTRHVWLTALIVAASWPLLIALWPRSTATPVAARSGDGSLIQLPSIVVLAENHVSWADDRILVGLWAFASVVLLGRLGLSAFRLARQRRRWSATAVDGMAVRVSADEGPAVVGVRRMEVVLPEWSLQLDTPLRALVLRHEEEHRRARDPWLLLIAAGVVASLPWNLPLWWIARRLQLAIEMDCDRRVLAAQPDTTRRYARLLLLMAQRNSIAGLHLVPGLLESSSHLERRLDAMRHPLHLSRARSVAIGVAATAAVVAACTAPSPASPPTRDNPPVAASPTRAAPAPAESPVDTSLNLTEIKALAKTLQPNEKIEGEIERRRDGTLKVTARKTATTPNQPQLDANQTFFEFQVDRQAVVAAPAKPKYPHELREQNVEGKVVMQFVVGADGRAEAPSFKTLQSTHPDFTAAVTTALSQMKFAPAMKQGRTVRQLVQMPFVFMLNK